MDREPSLVIGTELGTDTAYLFNIVVGAVGLTDGGTAVLNAGSASIRIFDRGGRHLRSMGRRGQGPGEFEGMGSFRKGPADALIVSASGNRVVSFSPNGQVLRTVRLTPPWGGVWGVFDDATMLVGPGGRSITSALPREIITVPLAHASTDGTILARLGDHPGIVMAGGSTLILAPRGYGAVGGSSFYWGFSERFEIREYALSGRLKRIVRREWTPVAITGNDKDRYWERRFRGLVGARTLAAERDRAARSEFAETFPAYAGLMLDAQGCLWVREQPLRPGEAVGDSASSWTVFDSTGRWIAVARLPGGFEVFEIGSDYVLGKRRVTLGVEQVIRYRLRRSMTG